MFLIIVCGDTAFDVQQKYLGVKYPLKDSTKNGGWKTRSGSGRKAMAFELNLGLLGSEGGRNGARVVSYEVEIACRRPIIFRQ